MGARIQSNQLHESGKIKLYRFIGKIPSDIIAVCYNTYIVVINVQMELNGLTGQMRFDAETGNRNYFKVDVVRVQESKKHRLGSWDPIEGMTLTRSASEMNLEFAQSITNKTFIVVGKLVSI